MSDVVILQFNEEIFSLPFIDQISIEGTYLKAQAECIGSPASTVLGPSYYAITLSGSELLNQSRHILTKLYDKIKEVSEQTSEGGQVRASQYFMTCIIKVDDEQILPTYYIKPFNITMNSSADDNYIKFSISMFADKYPLKRSTAIGYSQVNPLGVNIPFTSGKWQV
jgi:hypothetical protein